MSFPKIFISGYFLLLLSTAHSQNVDFTYSTGNGLFCNPQAVTFVQNCSGSPDAFIWRFGNGQSGSAPVENITYNLPGTYTVTLTAVYAANAISVTKTVVINPTPTITVSPNRNYICQPGNITFTAPGSAFITSYEWDFGDGNTQITATNSVIHFFNSYNNFTVTVKGVTANGCSALATTNVQVMKFPIINASVTPDNGCIPATSTLTASATLPVGDSPANFVWDFGDGSPNGNTAVNNTIHTYNIVTPITTASVTITTAQGCTNQYTFPSFAFGTPPFNTTAVTSDGRNTYCASETIQFDGTATNANSYSWDFGDGNTQVTNSTTITHRYRVLGNMTVIMTPYFNGCAGTPATINITIQGVIADYTFTNQCSAKNVFTYNNLSVGNVTSFRWTFSDIPGTPDAVNYNVTHTFPANGSFNTQFYLFDAITGCSDSLTTYQYTATPSFTSSKTNVCKDSLIQYTVLNPYPVLSNYQYEFHVDGTVVNTGVTSTIPFTPTTHGTFNEYVVIDGPGANTCSDTLYLASPTKVQGPVLNFSVPLTACFLNNSFPLTNNTVPFFPADAINNWQWSFGDNTTSTVQSPPAHSYPGPGAYTILLQATDINTCAQKDSVVVTVFPMPQLSVFPKVDTICSGQSLNLFAFTVDTLTWVTNYNLTCVTALCDTVLVNPMVTTSYIAQSKNPYGCINYDTSLIKVYAPFNLQVLPADTSVCPGFPVPYRANVNGITTWSPPPFLSAVNIINPVSTPDSSITYTIIVADSAGCYADTAMANITIYPQPTVNAGPDIIVPYNNPFTLSPIYSADVVAYLWTPNTNSLSCTNCAVTSGVADVTTTYTIEVTNDVGCKAKDDITVFVACSNANLHIPSGFTPNNDGRNDMLYPLAKGYKIINKFIVFNRWGNKVFERYNFLPNIPSLGWNGDTPDKQVSDNAVYVWIIEATCDVGEKIVSKGTVTVIR